jgi:hypothetical protein
VNTTIDELNEYNDRNSFDCYLYTRKEILKKSSYPYPMSNEPLADYYFKNLHKEFPVSQMFKFAGTQYICVSPKAVERLRKSMKKRLVELKREETKLCEFIDELI